MRICSTCKSEKSEEDFPAKPSGKGKLDTRCKVCRNAYLKQYRSDPEKARLAREYKKIWHQANKERLNKKSIEYSKKNKTRRKEYLKEYLPTRRKLRKIKSDSDPLHRAKVNLRCCITRAFSLRQGWGKLGKSEEIIGCSYEFAIAHIEKQFRDGMTWDNYGAGHGRWNIDHIIPLASAKTAEEVKTLCHYTNLQPLWFIDNVRKQDKMPWEWAQSA